ncbi:hypothetical protein [Burkholderia sp. BE17]|nr:hypothetical protein [Burkholderia sp. BE17]
MSAAVACGGETPGARLHAPGASHPRLRQRQLKLAVPVEPGE